MRPKGSQSQSTYLDVPNISFLDDMSQLQTFLQGTQNSYGTLCMKMSYTTLQNLIFQTQKCSPNFHMRLLQPNMGPTPTVISSQIPLRGSK